MDTYISISITGCHIKEVSSQVSILWNGRQAARGGNPWCIGVSVDEYRAGTGTQLVGIRNVGNQNPHVVDRVYVINKRCPRPDDS